MLGKINLRDAAGAPEVYTRENLMEMDLMHLKSSVDNQEKLRGLVIYTQIMTSKRKSGTRKEK